MRYLLTAALIVLSVQMKAQQPLTGTMTYRTYFRLESGQTQNWQSTMAIRGGESLIEDEQQRGKPIQKKDATHSTITAGLPMTVQHYKNLATRKLISRDHADDEMIIVDDVLAPIGWKILPDKKMVGGFSCQKARGRVRGRDYTVWFAPKIALSDGPWKLYGLPGLILEAEDDTREVRFELESLTIPASGTLVVAAPIPAKGQKRMTRAAQQQYIDQKFETVRKMLESKSSEDGVQVQIQIGKRPSIDMSN